MRVQPRRHILEMWRSLLDESYRDQAWQWGGRDGSSTVSDTEHLLCLVYPMTKMDVFAVADPDVVPPDVATALAALGSVTRIPRAIVEIAEEYFARHVGEDGEPRFNGGAYFHASAPGEVPTPEQSESLDVVDSYSQSVTLCLALLAFVRERVPLEQNKEWSARLARLAASASHRLTAALTGLLRSFVINPVTAGSDEERQILSMLRRKGESDADISRRVRERFGKLRAQLRDSVQLAVSEEAKPGEEQLFECGWTWGIAEGAAPIEADVVDLPIAVAPGVAANRPCLCFTVSALDAIADLATPRTRLTLLDHTQRRLTEALLIRWELTQRYWSTTARFDPDDWPLEDIPWRTSGGKESDYFSLQVMSVVIHDLIDREATDDAELLKAVGVLEVLADHGRITRRTTRDDPAAVLHAPGVEIDLPGSEKLGPELAWYSYDFLPVLLKRCMQAARLAGGAAARERLLAVAEAAMERLAECRLVRDEGTVELWDDASPRTAPAPGEPAAERAPSWYFTERVMEAMVATARTYATEPPRSRRLSEWLLRALSEADHLYNQELMASDLADRSALRDGLDRIGELISRARALRDRRTATAVALVEEALKLLDALAYASDDAERGRQC